MTDATKILPPPTLDPTPISPERELYRWSAPSRLYKKRNREFYTTVGALVILISIILLFAREFLLIGVIVSFGFVAYALASVKPDTLIHRLTNKGVRTDNKFYAWPQMSRFWWETKWHQDTIHFQLPNQFPGSVILLLGEGDKQTLETTVSKYLIKEKPAPTWIDQASKWLQEKVPLETEQAPPPKPANKPAA